MPPLHALADSLNPSSEHTRSALTNLSVMTLFSDLLLEHPNLTEDELVAALVGLGLPEKIVRERLERYPRGDRTIADLYSRASAVPTLQAIQAAAERCGLQPDAVSDSLLDCFRFTAGSHELVDFLETARVALAATPSAAGFGQEVERLRAEQAEARTVFDRAYRERFLLRHGLTEAQAEALLTELRALRAPEATVEELYVPLRRSAR